MSADPWLTVLQAARAPARRWLDLIRACGSAESLLALSRADLLRAGLSESDVGKLRASDPRQLTRWRRWLEAPDRKLITLGSPSYPELLGQVADPPLALWARGSRMDLLHAPQLAMVGSRTPTANGRETAERFARYLSGRGLTITSGLAAGVDGAAHRGGLAGEAGTVAVLGSGLDQVFPRSHRDLAEEIAANGVIVSEYPPGTPALGPHFPQRNRIIAGLSVGTLVVEAARRSGSLITARLAGEYGREVFAIPGSIHNPLTKGCHRLIREGAKLVEEAADVLVELAPLLQLLMENGGPAEETSGDAPPAITREPGYDELLQALGFDPCTIAALSHRTGLTAAELSSMLLLLEMEGLIEALPGGRYSRLPQRIP